MKKARYVLLAVLAVCFAAFAAAGCNDPEPGPGPEPGPSVTYTVEGAQDRYFKLSETAFDFSAGVTVKGSDGSVKTVTVDSSKVEFGKAGSYDVVYSYGDVSVTKKAHVLGLPTLKASEGTGAIESEYAEVQENLYAGLVATDSLGETLDIAVVEGTENPLYDERGIPQYGAHEVTYSATDRVGQTTEFTRTFTVKTGENTPVISGTPSADVADEAAVLEIDLKGNAVSAFYIGDTQFSEFSVQGGEMSIAISDLLETYAVGTYDATVMTNGGYADFTFEITDEKPIALGYFGLDNWTYETGKAGVFPVPEKSSPRQDVTFSYALKKGDAEVLTSADGTFTAPAAGVYTLTVTGTRASTDDSVEKTLNVYVLTAEEFSSTLARGDSLQNADELPFSYKTIEQNAENLSDSGYAEDEGIGPAYKMHTASGAGGGDQCQAFVLSGSSTDFGGSEIDAKYKAVTFDLYFAAEGTKLPWIMMISGLTAGEGYIKTAVTNRNSMGYVNSADTRYVRVYEINADGSRGRLANPSPDGWYRYEVSLAEYRGAATPFLWLGNEYGGSFYVRRVALSESAVNEDSLPILNNGNASNFGRNAEAALYWSQLVTFSDNQTVGGRSGVAKLTHTFNVSAGANDARGLALSFGKRNENDSTGDSDVPAGFQTLTLEFYAEAGADIQFYYGYDGTQHVFESAATSDKFCIYDSKGERIASPVADGWYTAEVDLASYYACVSASGGYGRMGILEHRKDHVIAVDPQTAFYTKDEFVPAPTPDLPLVATNNVLGTGYDNDGSWKTWTTFLRNQELDGRTGISTLSHDKNIASGTPDMRGLIMGLGAAETNENYGPDRVVNSEVPEGYRKLIFDLYCEAGAEVWFHYGYDGSAFRFANASSDDFCIYNAGGNRIGSPETAGWYSVEVNLAPFFACKTGGYGRMGILDNTAGHTIGIDPQSMYFSVEEFVPAPTPETRLKVTDNGIYGNIKPYFDTAAYGNAGAGYTFAENQSVGGRASAVTLATLTNPGEGNDRRNRAIGFGTLATAIAANDSVTDSGVPEGFSTMVFDLYAEEGAELSFLFGHAESLGGFAISELTDTTKFRLYAIGADGATGETLAAVPAGQWFRVVVNLADYRTCVSGSYGRLAICNRGVGTSISVDPAAAYYSTKAF